MGVLTHSVDEDMVGWCKDGVQNFTFSGEDVQIQNKLPRVGPGSVSNWVRV